MANLTGKALDIVITDEWRKIFKDLGESPIGLNNRFMKLNTRMAKPLFKVEPFKISDPKYPEADVTVEVIEHDKHSPINPNPSAGRSRTYMVVAGGKRSHPIYNSITAETKARALHAKMIAALKAEETSERSRIKNWGMF